MKALYSIFKKPIFWFFFLTLSLLGLFFSYTFFSKSFPIVDLKITMDREQALKKASELSKQFNFRPTTYKSAVSFDTDKEVQNYIELDGGGPKKLHEILQEGYYSPYYWRVRHFKEYDSYETEIFFTPDGRPYGFSNKISEEEPGPALSKQEAEKIAQNYAQEFWNVDFTNYTNVEAAQEIKPIGRVDHTFVYENKGKKIAEAPYRLTIIVRGASVTELKLSVKVPETFIRKYYEMRSFNNFIATIALIIMILLYVFGGCFIGLYYLIRWRWIQWRWPLLWGLIIGLLQALSVINEIPFLWFGYDTAIALSQFYVSIVIKILSQFFMYAGLSTFIFLVAEGLTRKAFPHQLQLWRLWSQGAGSSLQVLARTLGGYLIVGIDLAYVIAFYYIALHHIGWWTPSEALYDPNALATYFPWISPIASSLSAGFLEEAIFRAIPLASAALLGNRFGKRNIWIFCAFILQMAVFGAAHANYPAQPAYARLVELLIPSAIFGTTYLLFGLLPAVLSHYIFDVVWFSLPIFISHAPGIIVDKMMVVLISLIPLMVILYRRFRSGVWTSIPSYYYNSAWQPEPEINQEHHEQQSISFMQLSKKRYSGLLILTCAGIICCIFFNRFTYDIVPIKIARNDVMKRAKEMVPENVGTRIPLAGVRNPLEHPSSRNQHLFVWKKFGADIYRKLLDSYVMPPVWRVRLARFEGPLEERADEYDLFIADKTNLKRLNHKLPESLQRNSLREEQAQAIALQHIEEKYKVSKNNIQKVSAIPTQLPNRVDWKFVFNDLAHTIAPGQARITVEMADHEITDSYQHVYVPEQWDRYYKDEESFVQLFEMVKLLLFCIVMVLSVLIIFARSFRNIRFGFKLFLIIACTLAIKSAIQTINIWPLATITFNTIEPFSHQAWHSVTFWILYALFMALFLGLAAGFLQKLYFKSKQSSLWFKWYILIGIALGCIEAGLYTLLLYSMPSTTPNWPNFTYAGAYVPSLAQALVMLTNFIQYTLIALVLFTALDRLVENKKYRFLGLGLILLFGFSVFDFKEFMPVWQWSLVGIVWALCVWLLFYYYIRHVRAALPIIVATRKIIEVIPLIVSNPYPGSVNGSIFGALLVFGLSCYWGYQLYSSE